MRACCPISSDRETLGGRRRPPIAAATARSPPRRARYARSAGRGLCALQAGRAGACTQRRLQRRRAGRLRPTCNRPWSSSAAAAPPSPIFTRLTVAQRHSPSRRTRLSPAWCSRRRAPSVCNSSRPLPVRQPPPRAARSFSPAAPSTRRRLLMLLGIMMEVPDALAPQGIAVKVALPGVGGNLRVTFSVEDRSRSRAEAGPFVRMMRLDRISDRGLGQGLCPRHRLSHQSAERLDRVRRERAGKVAAGHSVSCSGRRRWWRDLDCRRSSPPSPTALRAARYSSIPRRARTSSAWRRPIRAPPSAFCNVR